MNRDDSDVFARMQPRRTEIENLPCGGGDADQANNRPAREVVIFVEKYEMTISLLVFEDIDVMPLDWPEGRTEDSFDRLTQSALR